MTRRLSRLFVAAALVSVASSAARAGDPIRPVDRATMVRIDGRIFEMGLDDAAVARLSAICETTGATRCGPDRFDRERGHLEVEVAPFLLDRDEVSRERYQTCVALGSCPPVDELACTLFEDGAWVTGLPIAIREDVEATPVTCVTLTEAEAYCRWVGARLPTEAEWAAAAGVGRRAFPWGNRWAADRANYGGGPARLESASEQHGQPWQGAVRQLAGNAYEWVAEGHPCAFGETCDEPDRAVIRGGSIASSPGSLRSTYRRFVAPDTRSGDLGFRCAADLEADQAAGAAEVSVGPSAEASASDAALVSSENPRVLAVSRGRLRLFDLASGAARTLFVTAGDVRSFGRIDADTIGLAVDPPLGPFDHYVWPSTSLRPRRSLAPADYQRVGDPLDACRLDPSRYRVDEATGTVSIRHDDGPEQVILRLDPTLHATGLTATESCVGDLTVIAWSAHDGRSVRRYLELLDAGARTIARSEGAYHHTDESGAERPWALWTPDRAFLLWSDYQGWYATDVASGRTRALGSSYTPPVYLAPGVEWRRPPADEGDAQGSDSALARALGARWVRRATITTDASGSRWVALPGAAPVTLFEVAERPDDATCIEEAEIPNAPVWLLADEPETALAWSFPPRFYQRDECLVSWPALDEPEGTTVAPATLYGLDHSGERTDRDWAIATLVLEHPLFEGEGRGTLVYTADRLDLHGASGRVLASVALTPIRSSGWEVEIGSSGLRRVGPESWRASFTEASYIDNTGVDGAFRNAFTVAIEPDGLRLVDVDYAGHVTEDPDELPLEVGSSRRYWDRQEAAAGSPCDVDPDSASVNDDGPTVGLGSEEHGFAHTQDLLTSAGRLVGEIFITETTDDAVLVRRRTCGIRSHQRSVRVRWILRTDDGDHVIVDEVSNSEDEVGLAFPAH